MVEDKGALLVSSRERGEKVSGGREEWWWRLETGESGMPWKFWVPFSYWHKMREQAWEIKSCFSQDSPPCRWGCQCQRGQGDGCEVLSGRGGQGCRITIQSLSIVLSDPAKDVWILLDFWWTSLGWNGDFLPGRTTVVGFLLTYAEGTLWPVRGQLTLSTLAISYALLVMALLLSHSWISSTWKPTGLQRGRSEYFSIWISFWLLLLEA